MPRNKKQDKLTRPRNRQPRAGAAGEDRLLKQRCQHSGCNQKGYALRGEYTCDLHHPTGHTRAAECQVRARPQRLRRLSRGRGIDLPPGIFDPLARWLDEYALRAASLTCRSWRDGIRGCQCWLDYGEFVRARKHSALRTRKDRAWLWRWTLPPAGQRYDWWHLTQQRQFVDRVVVYLQYLLRNQVGESDEERITAPEACVIATTPVERVILRRIHSRLEFRQLVDATVAAWDEFQDPDTCIEPVPLYAFLTNPEEVQKRPWIYHEVVGTRSDLPMRLGDVAKYDPENIVANMAEAMQFTPNPLWLLMGDKEYYAWDRRRTCPAHGSRKTNQTCTWEDFNRATIGFHKLYKHF